MGLTFSGLLPHPPIVVPAVGGSRGEECRRTTDACRVLARELVASHPERLLVVSPHSPRQRGELGWWSGERLRGDLGRFGAPGEGVDVPNDLELTGVLEETFAELGLPVRTIPSDALDHGAVVPLWFLAEAGWDGPTTILSLPWPSKAESWDEREVIAFGRGVARAGEKVGGPYALLASGDMTHRGKRGAPAGYHPRAAEFDAEFRERVARGALDRLSEIPADLRELAAEDVVSSSVLVAAAHGFVPREHRVISYEIPFGVGYLVAVFHRDEVRVGEGSDRSRGELSRLPSIAREAVRRWTEGKKTATHRAEGILAERAAVFVTLRERKTRKLRGCIGSLSPGKENLLLEVVDRAVAAAASDPRFPKVRAEELDGLQFEVSVLEPTEEVAGPEELDPQRYGVVVRDRSGRRGVLLPRIEGIDTVADQVDIARRKAGIPADAELFFERFRTVEVHEEGGGGG